MTSTILVFIVSGTIIAQKDAAESAHPPALTELQRLQVATVLQRLEIAQLKAQAAQRDFDEGKQALSALVTALQLPGYQLDLGTLTYRPVAPEMEPVK